jgi:cytosine/adenosine deaminase-related metal-dependent hydrolase
MVHAAEGVDQAAADEVDRLDELGCLRQNTVIVHGIAMGEREWRRVLERGASLVWCPASNDFLFGCTAAVRAHLDAHPQAWRHICLGSDSRISGSRDLLDEMRIAAARGISAAELLRMVTDAAARILRLTDAGRIARGLPADLVVLPPLAITPADSLVRCARRALALVTMGGRPVLGCPTLSAVFVARRTPAQPVSIDETERLVSCRLAHAIARCPISEPGVECLS